MTKQVTKGEQLFDAGCLMLTLVVDARPETNSEVVVFFESNTPGELVVIITNGAQHWYIVLGIDGRFPSLRRHVVMQQHRTGKGVYIFLSSEFHHIFA